MTPLLALVFYGITALVAGAGAYFGSYLKKKGENLATHEDIKQLMEQVSAVIAELSAIPESARSCCTA